MNVGIIIGIGLGLILVGLTIHYGGKFNSYRRRKAYWNSKMKRQERRGREIMEEKLQRFEPDSQVGLVDYLDEFIVALRKQLHEDFLRWGGTWRNRPKEGQELRTKARYTDYFDMFEQAGIPVPWLKIVGGALICWIRERHPEMCSDISIAEEVELLLEREVKKGPIEDIRHIITIEEFKNLVPHCTSYLQVSAYGNFAFKYHKEFCNSIKVGDVVSYLKVQEIDGVPSIDIIEAVIVDKEPNEVEHKSGCASFNNPPQGFASSVSECDCKDVDATIKVLGHAGSCEAEKPVEETTSSCPISGESDCDSCGAECTKDRNFWKVEDYGCAPPKFEKPVEEMTTKELVEIGGECNCQDCNLPNINDIMTKEKVPIPVSFTTGKAIDSVTHVVNERIINVWNGKLAYSSTRNDGRIILSSIKFTNGIGLEAIVLARCDEKGILIPHSRQIGIIGTVFADGRYQFRAIRCVRAPDIIYVSYDYTYEVPAEYPENPNIVKDNRICL